MKYLLDGYNILFRQNRFSGSLEEQRTQLLEKLNILAETGRLHLVVVFDAHQQVGEMERHHVHGIEVVYTDFTQTADEYVLEYVGCLSPNERRRTRVVTSDKTLMQKVRHESVEVLSVSTFFQEIGGRALLRGTKTIKPPPPVTLSKRERSDTLALEDNAFWIALFELRLKQMEGSNMCS